MQLRRKKSVNGFTFIEILVTVILLLTLSGLLVSGYSRFNDTQGVSQAAANLTSTLTSVRTKAKFGVKPDGCDQLVGYEVDFTATSYSTSAVCIVAGTQEKISATATSFVLPKAVTISPVPPPVTFLVLSQGVDRPEAIILKGAGSNTSTVYISPSGSIGGSVVIPPTPTPPPAGTNTGLLAQFFDDQTLTLSVGTRIDPNINFYWGTSKPFSGLFSNQSYSVRWTGLITPPATGQYTFTLVHDDGARLWVDDLATPLINAWTDGSGQTSGSTGFLTAGVAYPIKVEYYNASGVAQVILLWQSGSAVPYTVVPASVLSQN